MYSRNTFGSYYPVNSTIHRLNPLIKVINFLIVVFLSILSNSISITFFVTCLIFVMMLMSFVPFRYYLKTVFGLIPIYIIIAIIGYYLKLNITQIVTYILRILNVFEYIVLITYTTSSSESEYGIEKFLSLFNFLYLPISKLAVKINSIIRYYPLSLTVENRVETSSAARGIDYNTPTFYGWLYTSKNVREGKKRIRKIMNKEIAFSQELRLYNVQKYRTNYRTNKISYLDIFFLIFHLVLVYAALVEGGYL